MKYLWFGLGVMLLSGSLYNTEYVIADVGLIGTVLLNMFFGVMTLFAGWNILPPAKEID